MPQVVREDGAVRLKEGSQANREPSRLWLLLAIIIAASLAVQLTLTGQMFRDHLILQYEIPKYDDDLG